MKSDFDDYLRLLAEDPTIEIPDFILEILAEDQRIALARMIRDAVLEQVPAENLILFEPRTDKLWLHVDVLDYILPSLDRKLYYESLSFGKNFRRAIELDHPPGFGFRLDYHDRVLTIQLNVGCFLGEDDNYGEKCYLRSHGYWWWHDVIDLANEPTFAEKENKQKMRRNPDEYLRRLERAASQGDEDAALALDVEKERRNIELTVTSSEGKEYKFSIYASMGGTAIRWWPASEDRNHWNTDSALVREVSNARYLSLFPSKGFWIAKVALKITDIGPGIILPKLSFGGDDLIPAIEVRRMIAAAERWEASKSKIRRNPKKNFRRNIDFSSCQRCGWREGDGVKICYYSENLGQVTHSNEHPENLMDPETKNLFLLKEGPNVFVNELARNEHIDSYIKRREGWFLEDQMRGSSRSREDEDRIQKEYIAKIIKKQTISEFLLDHPGWLFGPPNGAGLAWAYQPHSCGGRRVLIQPYHYRCDGCGMEVKLWEYGVDYDVG